MNKEKAKRIIKEFSNAHKKYSVQHWGHFQGKLGGLLKGAVYKSGYWYWKGHLISNLYKVCK